MKGTFAAPWVLCAGAAAEPYRYDDIRLGASLTRLALNFDLRDIHAGIAAQQEKQSARPGLGRRGYPPLALHNPDFRITG